VLEVNEVKEFGTTIDVVLINGALKRGDQIVVCTKQVWFHELNTSSLQHYLICSQHIFLCHLQGPITTSIRHLLTPYPLKELRAKVSQ
jgi:translation initiation factor 5B